MRNAKKRDETYFVEDIYLANVLIIIENDSVQDCRSISYFVMADEGKYYELFTGIEIQKLSDISQKNLIKVSTPYITSMIPYSTLFYNENEDEENKERTVDKAELFRLITCINAESCMYY